MKRFLVTLSLLFVISLPFIYIYSEVSDSENFFEDIEETVQNSVVQDAFEWISEGFQTMVYMVEDLLESDSKTPMQDSDIQKPLLEEPVEQAFSIHNIEIGDSIQEVQAQLGEPKRISYNEYGNHWYTYHENYHNFLTVMFNEQDQVVGLFTNQEILSSKNGIEIGTDKGTVEGILGQPLSRIQKGFFYYQMKGNEDYQIYWLDGCYVTIFYDKHENNTVTSIQIISEEAEKKKQNLYGEGSTDLMVGFEFQLFDLTNATRVNYNLQPLVWDEQVRKTAREHSKDMAINDYFDHTNLAGQSPFDRMKEDRLFFTLAGENLAYGQFNSIYAHEGLMNSEGHRSNILQPEYEYLGIGVAFNSQSQPFFTENFYKK